MPKTQIRACLPADANRSCEIYHHNVAHANVTFEERAVDVAEVAARIELTSKCYPWLVFEHWNRMLGCACAGRWRTRSAYRCAAGTTVYVARDEDGRGIGRQLLNALLPRLTRQGIRSAFVVVALPNEPSAAIREEPRFRKVAPLKEVGYKFGRWIDVGHWQILRS